MSYLKEAVRFLAPFPPSLTTIVLRPTQQVNGDEHNVIMLLREQGLTQEAAYKRVGEEITHRYQEWYVALAGLPQWGEGVDAHVQRYVAAMQELVLSNLNWRFVVSSFATVMVRYANVRI